MGNSVSIKSFIPLVSLLHYQAQNFTTKKEYWTRFNSHKAFASFYERFFVQDYLTFSRKQLFDIDKGSFQDAIFAIVCWGYPKNPRGDNFIGILDNMALLENKLKRGRDLTVEEFVHLCFTLKGTGIGLSTLSKFLYFFEMSVNGHKCLIMDSWIIKILQRGIYQELYSLNTISDINREKYYVSYLSSVEAIASENNVLPDQLELFLFLYAKAIK